jgi:hypothetical protein
MNITLLNSRISLVLATAVTVCFAALPASAKTYRVSCKVGQTRSGRMRVQPFRKPTVTVNNPRIVRARYNAERSVLLITGLREGTTRVHFRGRKRVISAGTNRPVEQPKPFHDVVIVTVSGRVPDKTDSLKLTVGRNHTRSFSAKVFLRKRHRHVQPLKVIGSDVVKAWYEMNGERKLKLRGLQPGHAKVILRCQTWNYNLRRWVNLTYTIRVHVPGRTALRVAKVSYPTTVKGDAKKHDMIIRWRGTPKLPVTVIFRPVPGWKHPKGLILATVTGKITRTTDNPFRFRNAVWINSPRPITLKYEVVLRDASGKESRPIPAPITSTTETRLSGRSITGRLDDLSRRIGGR